VCGAPDRGLPGLPPCPRAWHWRGPRLRLAQAVDSQFDTAVVAAFEAILTSESEDYRTATDPEFVLMAPGSFEGSAHVADEAALVAVAAAFG
jgi:hypothetical protein